MTQWIAGRLRLARNGHRKSDLADDDILDAIAALWTVCRIRAGKAQFLKGHPSHNARGRSMRIVY